MILARHLTTQMVGKLVKELGRGYREKELRDGGATREGRRLRSKVSGRSVILTGFLGENEF